RQPRRLPRAGHERVSPLCRPSAGQHDVLRGARRGAGEPDRAGRLGTALSRGGNGGGEDEDAEDDGAAPHALEARPETEISGRAAGRPYLGRVSACGRQFATRTAFEQTV